MFLETVTMYLKKKVKEKAIQYVAERTIGKKQKKHHRGWYIGLGVPSVILPALFFCFCILVAMMAPLFVFAGQGCLAPSTGYTYDGRVPATDLDNVFLHLGYPAADPAQWLTGDVDMNPILASRLAALAKSRNQKINISSGFRSVEEQWAIWNDRIRRYPHESEQERRRWVAYPGNSRHQFGLAADVDGYPKYLSNNDLKPFGLYKPLSNENWHIEPVETQGGRNGTIDVPNILPQELRYQEINEDSLREFLRGRNSILAEEPYFSTILDVAKQKDVNPLLMFAITGQEQSFVPRTDRNALMIANNPFNVYHSWREHNVNILESATVAANTVKNLSKNRPSSENPIRWINLRGGAGGYAEDPMWWVGVSRIFNQLRREHS